MAVFDTNILIGALHGNKKAERAIEAHKASGAAITILNKYELVRGAKPQDEDIIANFIARFRLYTLDDIGVAESARIYKELRSKGLKINEFDVIIAGIAAANNEILITADNDFEGIGKNIVVVDLKAKD
ncbi:MAG: type II toxin-antitoxin system VapC family toxin [Candidatus Micrarchaeaceae archaeon]